MEPVSFFSWKMGAAFVVGLAGGIAAGWAYEQGLAQSPEHLHARSVKLCVKANEKLEVLEKKLAEKAAKK